MMLEWYWPMVGVLIAVGGTAAVLIFLCIYWFIRSRLSPDERAETAETSGSEEELSGNTQR